MIYKYKVRKVDVQHNIAVITALPIHKPLQFKPGQYASLGFMNGWRPSPMRCFSIIDGLEDGSVRFAVRIGGEFTRALSNLQTDDVLLVRGAFGTFYTDNTDKRVVMLASGIGITPFLSMLRRPPALPITLLYSNRSARNIPFYEELCEQAAKNSNIQLGFFASVNLKSNNTVIPGRISEKYIQKITTGSYMNSTYFICGPSSFTQQIRSMLENAGVNTDMIVSESFTQKTKGSMDAYTSVRRMAYGLSAATLTALVVGIMTLDLSRAVPKLASEQTQATKASASQSTPTTSSSDSTGSSTTNSADPSGNSNTDPTTSTQTQTNYQQPMSSVS